MGAGGDNHFLSGPCSLHNLYRYNKVFEIHGIEYEEIEYGLDMIENPLGIISNF